MSALGQLSSVLGAWYDFRDLNNLQRLITEWIADWGPDWLASIVTGVLGALGILAVIGPTLLILIWVERKVISRFPAALWPNRVGPKGLLHNRSRCGQADSQGAACAARGGQADFFSCRRC